MWAQKLFLKYDVDETVIKDGGKELVKYYQSNNAQMFSYTYLLSHRVL